MICGLRNPNYELWGLIIGCNNVEIGSLYPNCSFYEFLGQGIL